MPPTSTLLRLSALALLAAVSACAAAPDSDSDAANDPAESTNRKVFAANQFVDRNAIKPVARAYQENVPSPARKGIHNFVSNLNEPGVAVNDLLQGNAGRAWNTTQRFVVNTTVGGAGLFDVATGWNRPHHSADFGQTLGVWGVGPGPSVQLPLFGPSNLRDSAGLVGGFLTNPANLVTAGAATVVKTVSSGMGVVDGRAGLLGTTDSLEKTSLDYYATLRSAMAQRRAAIVEEGKAGRVSPNAGAAVASPSGS